MVGGERPRLRRERRAAHVGQLVGVQLDAQAVRARRGEHALRLRRREADRFAERIDGVGGTGRGDRGDHVAADVVDVVVGASGELRRQRMRGEQRRAHVDAQLFAQRARDRSCFNSVAVSSP